MPNNRGFYGHNRAHLRINRGAVAGVISAYPAWFVWADLADTASASNQVALLGPETGDWGAHQLREREAGRLPPGKDGALQIRGKKGEAYQAAGIR